ncbi:MAG: C25 family cysteine peptidase [candidate division WOR-3 bacterium]
MYSIFLILLSIQYFATDIQSVEPPKIKTSEISIGFADNNGIVFRYAIDEDEIEPVEVVIDNHRYTTFNIPGLAHNEDIGSLDLPSKEVLIGIPQNGNISVVATPIRVKKIEPIKLAPVPYRSWDSEPKYYFSQQDFGDIYPAEICQVKEISYIRNVRVARLKIYPVQYSQLSSQAIINLEIDISVRFSQAAEDDLRPDYFDNIIPQVLLNGEIAKNWKSPSNFEFLESGYSKFPQGFVNWYKIKIESTGVYKITYDELQRAGIPIRFIDPRTIRLFNIGNWISNEHYPDTMCEIPIYISGEQDSTFNQNDYILFYGVSPSRYDAHRRSFYNNPFTLYNYYWLTWGFGSNAGFGQRMATIVSGDFPNRVYSAENFQHIEQDRDCPARSGLLWLWELFAKPVNVSSQTFNLSLPILNAESIYTIAGRFYGQTYANWLKVAVNDIMLDSFYFPGASSNPTPFYFQINRRLPASATNMLSFTLYNNPEQNVYLDYLQIRYRQKLELATDQTALDFYLLPGDQSMVLRKIGNKPIVLEVSNYHEPKRVVNFITKSDTIIVGLAIAETSYFYVTDESKARRVLSIEPRQVGQITDYLNTNYFIVVADELYPSVLLLENYRQNNIAGLPQAKVKALPLTQIYDNFTFGIEEPGAIKRLFKKCQPYYGLLLGDGTYDYRNILQLATFPAVPAYEQGYDIDYQVYSANALALDAWYSDFDGSGSTPDMMLGRVTARTHNEVRKFYERVVSYDSRSAAGFWNKRFVFLADDEWKKQGILDREFVSQSPPHTIDHVAKCEALEQYLAITNPTKFRHFEPVKVYLTEYPFVASDDKQLARQTLISELNKGVSLWAFFGHGAGYRLCHEQALDITYLPLVNTEKRYNIAFFGSCGVGRFDDTRYESIAEELVRKEDGSIITIGATKATDSNSNLSFANALFGKIISQPESTVGRAFIVAIYANNKYHLFGDPATVPAIPNYYNEIVSQPDTLRAGQRVWNYAQVNNCQMFASAAYASKWQRYYQSVYYNTVTTPPTPETIKMYYNLAGYELFRGHGRIINDSIKFQFFTPSGLPRTIRYDIINGGGYYTEINNSARVSAIGYVHNQKQLYSFVNDSMYFDTLPAVISDSVGPTISFYINDKRIRPNEVVPKEFVLTGVLADSSGILLSPIPNYNPRLIIKALPNRILQDIDVSSYFNYDLNNFYQGRFSLPVALDSGEYLLSVTAADNFRNLSKDSVRVTVNKTQSLEITNVLYYSPPNSRIGYFTFTLNKPALVTVKIYTINGRLIKTLPERFCNWGYNQIEWNGLDEWQSIPANGVYLYKLSARTFAGDRIEKQSVVEKFVIFK